ncbi:hypothetical protein M5K25_003816 [Dendrobium thyrsiflorum]|uniref:Uncharacterized protein n=1 Tax=Dendrobium thyrsiflorum TaxID=117978 RepID=A0ABD0VSR4_DENTH
MKSKFNFQSFSIEDDDYEGYDYSLSGRLSAVRIIFLYRFVLEKTNAPLVIKEPSGSPEKFTSPVIGKGKLVTETLELKTPRSTGKNRPNDFEASSSSVMKLIVKRFNNVIAKPVIVSEGDPSVQKNSEKPLAVCDNAQDNVSVRDSTVELQNDVGGLGGSLMLKFRRMARVRNSKISGSEKVQNLISDAEGAELPSVIEEGQISAKQVDTEDGVQLRMVGSDCGTSGGMDLSTVACKDPSSLNSAIPTKIICL